MTAPGGPWGGYPGRGAWRFPNVYDATTAGSASSALNIAANHRINLAVTAIQDCCSKNGFNVALTGEYDLATVKAITAFQRDRGPKVLGAADGIVGPLTARALFRVFALFFQGLLGIPDNIAVGQLSWESGGWDPGVEGQLDPRDRGLAQINSTFHPTITDAQAYDAFHTCIYLCQQQHDQHDRLSALRPVGSKVNGWDLAITYNKGPAGAEQWAKTGIAPDGYEQYVSDVRSRGVYESHLS